MAWYTIFRHELCAEFNSGPSRGPVSKARIEQRTWNKRVLSRADIHSSPEKGIQHILWRLYTKKEQIQGRFIGSGKEAIRAKKNHWCIFHPLFLSIGHPEVITENQLPDCEIVLLLFRTMVMNVPPGKTKDIKRKPTTIPKLISCLKSNLGSKYIHPLKGLYIFFILTAMTSTY